MAKIDAFLTLLAENNASDLHMVPNDPPILRVNGKLRRTSLPILTSEQNKEFFYEILKPTQIRSIEEHNEIDLSYELKGIARFRGNIFKQNNGISGVFRIIPTHVFSADELGLLKVIKDFTRLKNGLVLVTGPTGSGKSTTLAALIDLINSEQKAHIITIEDPLEFVHEEKLSLISHREVNQHTLSFSQALRASMREDPDVIMVGEMRDLETIALALTAAEMGVLVFGTLHTNSAPKTINRIIDVFPDNQQEQIRTILASTLKGVIAQQLLEKKDKSGRVAAYEVLVVNSGISNLIREGKSHQIASIMETSKQEGNCTMDQTLMQLFKNQSISALEAYRKAHGKQLFEKFVEEERETPHATVQGSSGNEVLNVTLRVPEKNEKKMGNFIDSIMTDENIQDSFKETMIIPLENITPPPIKLARKISWEDFPEVFGKESAKAIQTNSATALILIEIPGLEQWIAENPNRSRDMEKAFQLSLRENDLYASINSEVYIAICPGLKEDVDRVSHITFEKFNALFSQFDPENAPQVRIGNAVFPDSGDDLDQLIELASMVKFF
ncbi:type IV pilus twitching motility protein PilT [bacterium]|nr:type IV pilus twitching motility protein PilT [bacterium]MCP5462099.1 type IV pilus twitching motility protein PilT [bacterium]